MPTLTSGDVKECSIYPLFRAEYKKRSSMTSIDIEEMNTWLRKFDSVAKSNPCATIRLPGGVVEASDAWRARLGRAVGDKDAQNRLADTLTGCEVLAWFIDRFGIYGAGRSVPAKLLLHQIMDVIDEICRMKSGKSNFEPAVTQCFPGDEHESFRNKVIGVWRIRHRSHLSASRDERDHGYDYFPCIDRAWQSATKVIDMLGGNCSDYSGILCSLSSREEQRQRKSEAEKVSL